MTSRDYRTSLVHRARDDGARGFVLVREACVDALAELPRVAQFSRKNSSLSVHLNTQANLVCIVQKARSFVNPQLSSRRKR